MKKLLSLVFVFCVICSTTALGAASDQGCDSSGNTAAGCGGTTNNGGNGGNGGSGGQGGNGGNSTVGAITNTNTANGGSVGDVSNTSEGGSVENSVDVSGDSGSSYSYGAPSLSPALGTEALQLHSIFGGISVSNTEDYAVQIAELNTLSDLVKAEIITASEAREAALHSIKRLHWSSRPKRLLGVGPKSRGKHLFNLFGLLATDSYREDK